VLIKLKAISFFINLKRQFTLGSQHVEFDKATNQAILEKATTGNRRFLIATPLDRIAVISLSAERRPKQIRIPKSTAMGIENVRTPGRM